MFVEPSVWIDYFNGHASPEADRLAQAMFDAEPIALPGLVWTELLTGLRTESEATNSDTSLRFRKSSRGDGSSRKRY